MIKWMTHTLGICLGFFIAAYMIIADDIQVPPWFYGLVILMALLQVIHHIREMIKISEQM